MQHYNLNNGGGLAVLVKVDEGDAIRSPVRVRVGLVDVHEVRQEDADVRYARRAVAVQQLARRLPVVHGQESRRLRATVTERAVHERVHRKGEEQATKLGSKEAAGADHIVEGLPELRRDIGPRFAEALHGRLLQRREHLQAGGIVLQREALLQGRA